MTLKVYVYGTDPLSQAGMTAYLHGLDLLAETDVDRADVALVIVDTVDEAAVRVLTAMQRDGTPKVVLLAAEIDAAGVSLAVQCGVVGVVRRSEATPASLFSVVTAAAAGDAVIPPDLLGGLLRQVASSPPSERSMSRPTEREVEVLRLLSDGCDTREVARTLCYSERTVKNVIQDVTRRFGLRNRSHAVAYALRNGFI